MTELRVNDFYEDLAFSTGASLEDFWGDAYRIAFPDMVRYETCEDLDWQRLGVDRVIYLSSGHTLHIDEKTRRKVYHDIVLEYVSNDRYNTPGWIEKNLSMDYLAYAFLPTRKVFLFPWQPLRRAWETNKSNWLAKYRNVRAPNHGYNTLSVAIPIIELRREVAQAMVVTVPNSQNRID